LQLFETKGWFDSIDFWEAHSAGFYNAHIILFTAAAVLYLPSIYLLKKWMEPRKAYDLTNVLRFWNVLMWAFSTVGTYFTLIEPALNGFSLLQRFQTHYGALGVYATPLHTFLCSSWCYRSGNVAFAVMIFDISKVFEFTDTAFILLRKRPLIFLHYYHHIITMLFCWYTNQYGHFFNCGGYSFATMNYLVHSAMYGYYALRSFNIRPSFDIFITVAQILQMVVGIFVLLFTAQCPGEKDWFQIAFGLGMYFSFFLLFMRVYNNRYGDKPKAAAGHKKEQ